MELSDNFFKEIRERSLYFTVGIIGLRDSENKPIPLGSGSLINLLDIYAILTVNHVASKIADFDKIGLTISHNSHNFNYDKQELNVVYTVRGVEDSLGPDLALIILPSAKIGQIDAQMSFYNLSYWRTLMTSREPSVNYGAWLLCGLIDEYTKDEQPESGFGVVKNFELWSSVSKVRNYRSYEGYDYFDYEIPYNEQNMPLPQTFGGTSGGGIWFITLYNDEKGNTFYNTDELFLSGVAFYETEIKEGYRYIICHGWRSILDHIYPVLSSLASMPQG